MGMPFPFEIGKKSAKTFIWSVMHGAGPSADCNGQGGGGGATRLSFLLPLRKDKGSLRGLTRGFSIEAV